VVIAISLFGGVNFSFDLQGVLSRDLIPLVKSCDSEANRLFNIFVQLTDLNISDFRELNVLFFF